MTTDTCIEFKDVVAGYKDFMILNNLSFQGQARHHHPVTRPQRRGQIHGTQSTVWFAQTTPGRHPARRRERGRRTPKATTWHKALPLCPRAATCFGQLSVFENLELGGITLGMKTTHERIPEVLEFFPRVSQRLHSPASALSGGEQKQLEIGRALLLRPKVILIDEPSIGLSPMVVADVFKLLAQTRRPGHHGADGGAKREERTQDFGRSHCPRIRPLGAAKAGIGIAGGPEYRAPVFGWCAHTGAATSPATA